MVRNSIYDWFIALVVNKTSLDNETTECLQRARAFQSLDLARIREENPGMEKRLTERLLSVSKEVATGTHPLRDPSGQEWPELQSVTQKSFRELATLLEGFQQRSKE